MQQIWILLGILVWLHQNHSRKMQAVSFNQKIMLEYSYNYVFVWNTYDGSKQFSSTYMNTLAHSQNRTVYFADMRSHCPQIDGIHHHTQG